jgi:hypothetical protein
MHRLIWILLILSILWCAWWALFGFGLKIGLQTWFEDRRNFGWQAEYSSLDLRGFPIKVRADLTDIAVADPTAGIAITLPSLSIGAPTYWPGDVTVKLPNNPIGIATPQQKSEITVSNGTADLQLHPGTALELETLSLLTGAWATTTSAGRLYSADDLTLSMVQSEDDPNRYAFVARASAFRPGDVPRAKLRIPNDWPLTFQRLELDASITFSRPWDLEALEEKRPQPRLIKLKLAEAAWFDLRMFFAADLVVDAQGIPTGTVNIQAENWQTMLDLAENSGLLNTTMRTQAEQGLGQLARFSGDPTALDVQLNFRSGFVAVGIIPIGPAPRFILR